MEVSAASPAQTKIGFTAVRSITIPRGETHAHRAPVIDRGQWHRGVIKSIFAAFIKTATRAIRPPSATVPIGVDKSSLFSEHSSAILPLKLFVKSFERRMRELHSEEVAWLCSSPSPLPSLDNDHFICRDMRTSHMVSSHMHSD